MIGVGKAVKGLLYVKAYDKKRNAGGGSRRCTALRSLVNSSLQMESLENKGHYEWCRNV